ncbi:autophagy-related protein 13-domain-containing protein [Mycotypha africana]|uniref:autophagy-related protein 13-domain-containing protein n=1 Tax=Mycotypha africana TaxID=64632 RepID=UPI0023004595|nr:autophagy-related protein 13-domain-containing protein [Mycotypha africana]KAI8975663.1 autophagy-related protein 13-domain-containing protein [Mycotypha africana]
MNMSKPQIQQQQQQQDEPATDSSIMIKSTSYTKLISSTSSSSYMSYSPLPSSADITVNKTGRSIYSRRSLVINDNKSIDKTTLSASSSMICSMSAADNKKLEQMVQNFYTKATQIILQARVNFSHTDNVEKHKVDKWFNISTKENVDIKDKLKFWKSFIRYQCSEHPPPLIIDIYLKKSSDQQTLLESWTLSLTHPIPDYPVDLPNLYKKSIVFFRVLHSLVRVLPCYSMYQKSKGTEHFNGNQREEEFVLDYRLGTNPSERQDAFSFGQKINSKDAIRSYNFKAIPTPLGTLKLNLLFLEANNIDSSIKAIEEPFIGHFDIDENFFGPFMSKFDNMQSSGHSITSRNRHSDVYGSSFNVSTDEIPINGRLHSYRSSQALLITNSRSSVVSSSTSTTTTSTEKRMSVPTVRPFKSPSVSSFSSSHQMETLLDLANTSSRGRQRSSSFEKRASFSSSFDKYFKPNSHHQQITVTTITNNDKISHMAYDLHNMNNMTKQWTRKGNDCNPSIQLNLHFGNMCTS